MFSIAAEYCTYVHRASSMLNVFIMLYNFFFFWYPVTTTIRSSVVWSTHIFIPDKLHSAV